MKDRVIERILIIRIIYRRCETTRLSLSYIISPINIGIFISHKTLLTFFSLCESERNAQLRDVTSFIIQIVIYIYIFIYFYVYVCCIVYNGVSSEKFTAKWSPVGLSSFLGDSSRFFFTHYSTTTSHSLETELIKAMRVRLKISILSSSKEWRTFLFSLAEKISEREYFAYARHWRVALSLRTESESQSFDPFWNFVLILCNILFVCLFFFFTQEALSVVRATAARGRVFDAVRACRPVTATVAKALSPNSPKSREQPGRKLARRSSLFWTIRPSIVSPSQSAESGPEMLAGHQPKLWKKIR